MKKIRRKGKGRKSSKFKIQSLKVQGLWVQSIMNIGYCCFVSLAMTVINEYRIMNKEL